MDRPFYRLCLGGLEEEVVPAWGICLSFIFVCLGFYLMCFKLKIQVCMLHDGFWENLQDTRTLNSLHITLSLFFYKLIQLRPKSRENELRSIQPKTPLPRQTHPWASAILSILPLNLPREAPWTHQVKEPPIRGDFSPNSFRKYIHHLSKGSKSCCSFRF